MCNPQLLRGHPHSLWSRISQLVLQQSHKPDVAAGHSYRLLKPSLRQAAVQSSCHADAIMNKLRVCIGHACSLTEHFKTADPRPGDALAICLQLRMLAHPELLARGSKRLAAHLDDQQLGPVQTQLVRKGGAWGRLEGKLAQDALLAPPGHRGRPSLGLPAAGPGRLPARDTNSVLHQGWTSHAGQGPRRASDTNNLHTAGQLPTVQSRCMPERWHLQELAWLQAVLTRICWAHSRLLMCTLCSLGTHQGLRALLAWLAGLLGLLGAGSGRPCCSPGPGRR